MTVLETDIHCLLRQCVELHLEFKYEWKQQDTRMLLRAFFYAFFLV